MLLAIKSYSLYEALYFKEGCTKLCMYTMVVYGYIYLYNVPTRNGWENSFEVHVRYQEFQKYRILSKLITSFIFLSLNQNSLTNLVTSLKKLKAFWSIIPQIWFLFRQISQLTTINMSMFKYAFQFKLRHLTRMQK